MDELDRVLDRDDVAGVVAVDEVDHRRQRGRLAAPGRPGHQHQARLQIRTACVSTGGTPSFSIETILVGHLRNTAPRRAPARKKLPRKRATPGIDVAKSRSCSRSKRCHCASLTTSRNSSRSARRLSTGRPSISDTWPLLRTIGARPEDKCRSEPPTSLRCFKVMRRCACQAALSRSAPCVRQNAWPLPR